MKVSKFINILKSKIIDWLPYGLVREKIKKNGITRETSVEPLIYNALGEFKRTFYLQDRVCCHSPYSFSSINVGQTKYINWDRFNNSLSVKFYSHGEVFKKKDIGSYDFAILVESETIDPALYECCLSNPHVMNEFKAIFTHSERIINAYKNAFFIPGSSVWYGGTAGGGKLDSKQYLKKFKNISLVSSDKSQCDLHRYRIHLADLFCNTGLVDVMGTYNGGNYVSISDSLTDYRFSIVVENNITKCYFTEKLLNCFASMTIPIYIGATDIGNFFNTDGIIVLKPNMSDLQVINLVRSCTDDLYRQKIGSIIDNYNRVHEYFCIEDYIFEHYKYLFDDSKVTL